MNDAEGLTYGAAGVDIAAGEAAVERIKRHVESTHRPEVLSKIGGFGGLFDAGFDELEDPVLVSSTDGVGTKSKLAVLARRYDTIGLDVVAMSVDDIAVQGAEPLFFLDYLSVGKVVTEVVDAIVSGVARGCREAGCALLGGEISEHPGLMGPDDFDLVGFAVGVVDRAAILPAGVDAGDAIVGIASPGVRCNGYSLVRRALLDRGARVLDEAAWPGADTTLADELLLPSVIYAPAMAHLRARVEVHAFAHITGGGLPANIARVLPPHLDAVVERGSWSEPRIFAEVQRAGDVADSEMVSVFNLGIGMAALVPKDAALDAVAACRSSGHEAWVIGHLGAGTGQVHVGR